MEIKNKIQKCGRTIYSTDFDSIFILDLNKQEPIKKILTPENLSVMRDYSIRDSWIFNRLTKLLKDNVIQLARQHCHDTRLSQTHWMRIVTNTKLNTLTPISLSSDFYMWNNNNKCRCLKLVYSICKFIYN